MHYLRLIIACSSLLFGTQSAAKLLHLELSRELLPPTHHASALAARQQSSSNSSFLEKELLNVKSRFQYYVVLQVGSPPQEIKLMVGTAAHSTLLLDKNGTCSEIGAECLTPFDRTLTTSSTNFNPSEVYYNLYGSTSANASGSSIRDLVSLSPSSSTNSIPSFRLIFTLASNHTSLFGPAGGILGLGYRDPSSLLFYPSPPDPTFLDQVVASNITHSRLYSIWLNSLESNAGSVLFGGVDTEKFLGELIVVPVALRSGELRGYGYYSSHVNLNTISISGQPPEDEIKFAPVGVLLDTGVTGVYLPTNLTERIYTSMGAKVRDGIPYLECNSTSSEFLAFGFENGAFIKVPYTELVTGYLVDTTTRNIQDDLGFKEACVLGIFPNDDYALLGQLFLRSAYVVFDIENSRVGLAQTNSNATKSNPIAVKAGRWDFPVLTGGQASIVWPSSTSTSTTALPTRIAPTRTSATSALSSATGASGGVGLEMNVGLGVVGAVVGGWVLGYDM